MRSDTAHYFGDMKELIFRCMRLVTITVNIMRKLDA